MSQDGMQGLKIAAVTTTESLPGPAQPAKPRARNAQEMPSKPRRISTGGARPDERF